jgi:N-carbamoylputrescine amidase
VLIVPMFEKRAPGLYHNSAAVSTRTAPCSGLPEDAHPGRPALLREVLLHPGRDLPPRCRAGEGVGLPGFRHPLRADRGADLLGPVVSGGRQDHRADGCAGALLSDRHRLAPGRGDEWGTAQADAWRTIQRGHAIANGVYVAAANRVGHEPEPGTDGIEFFGHSFVCDPFGRILAEAGTDPGHPGGGVRPGRSSIPGATGPSAAIGGSTPTGRS